MNSIKDLFILMMCLLVVHGQMDDDPEVEETVTVSEGAWIAIVVSTTVVVFAIIYFSCAYTYFKGTNKCFTNEYPHPKEACKLTFCWMCVPKGAEFVNNQKIGRSKQEILSAVKRNGGTVNVQPIEIRF